MVKELIHDPLLLARKSQPASREDMQVVQDLMDTFAAHRETCVGMAANMIGEFRNIIIFNNKDVTMVMLNPEIIRQEGPYTAKEGCLSLLGGPREAVRYQKIKVRYETTEFQTRLKTFTGWTAEIIQHEIDHCRGVLI